MDLYTNSIKGKKMKSTTDTFEIELNSLLKKYFGEDELIHIDQNLNSSNRESDKITELINDFYRNQLQIDTNNYCERIIIDRTITFSEKKLQADEYCKFLLDLGNLCLSGGRLNIAEEVFRKTKKSSNKQTLMAESLLGLSDVYSRRADWKRSLKTVIDAELLYREINDNSGIARCNNLLGIIFGERGELVKARKYLLNSLFLINPETDLKIAADLNMNLGIIDSIQGNYDNSLRHLKSAQMSYLTLGDEKKVAEVNHNIGMAYFESDDYKSAISYFDQAIEIAKAGRFMFVLCLVYLAKSQVLIKMNDITNAAEFADKSFEISHNIDDKLTLADIYKTKGIIQRYLHNYQESENFLLSSINLNTRLKNEQNIAETYFELAILYDEMNKSESKNNYLKKSLDYFKQINAVDKVNTIENMLALRTA